MHRGRDAMPVIIHAVKKQIPVRTGRGGTFDTAVRELTPSIAKFRSAGFRDIRKLLQQLNGAGLTAPSGKPFSYGTLLWNTASSLDPASRAPSWARATYRFDCCEAAIQSPLSVSSCVANAAISVITGRLSARSRIPAQWRVRHPYVNQTSRKCLGQIPRHCMETEPQSSQRRMYLKSQRFCGVDWSSS